MDDLMKLENINEFELLTNEKKQKVILNLKKYFQNCSEFKIVVAFITSSGVSLLKTVLKELEDKNIKGQIVTGDYQLFTSPYALEELNKLSNVKIKMIRQENFHMKGYFFHMKNKWTVVIGSSNLTQNALTVNSEMNLKVDLSYENKMLENIMSLFEELWNRAEHFKEFIQSYKKEYLENKTKQLIKHNVTEQIFEPNQMQIRALHKLENEHKLGNQKALIIAATGTGKTYLCAFDVLKIRPKKLLFIVHRESIAKKAKLTFESIIKDKTCGLYTGNTKEQKEYMFVTIQSLVNSLENFKQDEFDYIIIDEVHHLGAKSYQKVLNYFKYNFLLGLTATPKRSDNFNIFEMFDFNVAYDISLNKAYEYNLLAPFHYFGVSEIKVNDVLLNDSVKEVKFKDLISSTRVDHIIDKIKYYGNSEVKVQGLIFVSLASEALELSNELNKRGLKTKALLGTTKEEDRLLAIKKLEKNELEYLITVDIFNEGVDIPCINQIVLIRPTTSAIVYTQQIGRGLRKYTNKEYVTIIDFIGNYKNNFLIPIALSGDVTYDKDILKENILPNIEEYLIGSSSISFERVAYETILNNISNTNLAQINFIKRDFLYLKDKLNEIPTLTDFYTNNLISPIVILQNKKIYLEVKYNILKETSKEIKEIIKDNKNDMYLFLEYMSQKLTPAKRIEEIMIIKFLLVSSKGLDLDVITNEFESNGYKVKREVLENALLHLTKHIFKTFSPLFKFKKIVVFDEKVSKYKLSSNFYEYYTSNKIFKAEVDDLINLNIKIYNDKYKKYANNLITIGEPYTKEEAFKYLLLDYNNGYQVGGYTLLKDKKVGLIFITLSDSMYSNVFYTKKTFNWFSTKRRKLKYLDGKLTAEGLVANNYFKLYTFVKNEKSDSFVYIGEVEKVVEAKEIKNKQNESMVECVLELKESLNDKLYERFGKLNKNISQKENKNYSK